MMRPERLWTLGNRGWILLIEILLWITPALAALCGIVMWG